MKKCKNCNTEFEEKSQKAKFCSDKCRVSKFRATKKMVTVRQEIIFNAEKVSAFRDTYSYMSLQKMVDFLLDWCFAKNSYLVKKEEPAAENHSIIVKNTQTQENGKEIKNYSYYYSLIEDVHENGLEGEGQEVLEKIRSDQNLNVNQKRSLIIKLTNGSLSK